MVLLTASLLELRTSMATHIRITVVRKVFIVDVHLVLVGRAAAAIGLLESGRRLALTCRCRWLIAEALSLHTAALHLLLLERLVERDLPRCHSRTPLCFLLLAHALPEVRTRLHVQLSRR